MKREKKWGHKQTQTHDDDDTHPGANYSRRRNLFRRRQKNTFVGALGHADTDGTANRAGLGQGRIGTSNNLTS